MKDCGVDYLCLTYGALLAGEGAQAFLDLDAKVLRELLLGDTLQDIGGEGIAEHQLGFL